MGRVDVDRQAAGIGGQRQRNGADDEQGKSGKRFHLFSGPFMMNVSG
jgi:hypothetical protein